MEPAVPDRVLSRVVYLLARYREVAALIVVAAVINFCGITWGLPAGATDWAIDSIAPLGPLAYAHDVLHGVSWSSKYPPLHFTIVALAYAPYLGWLLLTGSMRAGQGHYPFGFSDPETSLAVLTLTARGVSALMGIGATLAAYATARQLAGRRAGLFAGLLFSTSPLVVYYAGNGNLDMPYVFWSSLALWALVRIARGASVRAYIALGVSAAAAVATKDQAYGLFLLLPVPLLAIHVRRGAHAWRDGRLLAGFGAAIVTYAVAANVLIDFGGWLAHVRFIIGPASAPYQMFPATAAGYGALAARSGRFLVDAATWPVLALAAVGLHWTFRRRIAGAVPLAFAAAAYATLFLGAILYVFPRFLLPVIFVVCVFAGIGAMIAWDTRRPLARAVLVVGLTYAVVYGTSMDAGFLWDSRYAAERWLADHLGPGAVVGTDAQAAYLPRLPKGTRVQPITMRNDGSIALDDAPPYLILSDAQYRKYFRHAPRRASIERLLGGELGYEAVATFYQPGLPATDLVPSINPTIVILQRRDDTLGDPTSVGSAPSASQRG